MYIKTFLKHINQHTCTYDITDAAMFYPKRRAEALEFVLLIKSHGVFFNKLALLISLIFIIKTILVETKVQLFFFYVLYCTQSISYI